MYTLGECSARLRELYKAASVDWFSFQLMRDTVLEKHGFNASSFYLRPDAEISYDSFFSMINDARRLLSGYPLQYYTGTADFCGLLFEAREDVLIPRRETEQIVTLSEKLLPENALVADICCGSGCIGASLLVRQKSLRAVFIDKSPSAISLTKANLFRLGVADRAEVIEEDIFSQGLIQTLKTQGGYNAVLTNPPYIKSSEMALLPENVKREPSMALDGGEDGLSFYGALFDISEAILKPRGFVIAECGYESETALMSLALSHGFAAEKVASQFLLCRRAAD